jgi:hypothetical protein
MLDRETTFEFSGLIPESKRTPRNRIHPVRNRDLEAPDTIRDNIEAFTYYNSIDYLSPKLIHTPHGETRFSTTSNTLEKRFWMFTGWLRAELEMIDHESNGLGVMSEIWTRRILNQIINHKLGLEYKIIPAPTQLDSPNINNRDRNRGTDMILVNYFNGRCYPVAGVDVTIATHPDYLNRKVIGSIAELAIPVVVLKLGHLEFITFDGKPTNVREYLSDVRFAVRNGCYDQFIESTIKTNGKLLKTISREIRSECKSFKDVIKADPGRFEKFRLVKRRLTQVERVFSDC